MFNPSITWIGHYSPMGYGLLKFYADRRLDEVEMVKRGRRREGVEGPPGDGVASPRGIREARQRLGRAFTARPAPPRWNMVLRPRLTSS